MASDLVLRLCQVDEADGGLPGAGLTPGDPGYIASNAHITIGDFRYVMIDLLGGYHTLTQVKNNLSMTPAQGATFDLLVSRVTSATGLEAQHGRIRRIESIIAKYERRRRYPLAAYDTPDEVETALLAIDTGF